MRLSENDILTPALLRRFEAEGQFEGADGRHYGIILRDDCSLMVHHPGSPLLDPVQSMWARDVLALLNRELHHDGAWVCVFTHVAPTTIERSHPEYGRYCLIWIDEDADPQFSVEWERGDSELRTFLDVLLQGREATAQKCETAWQIWHHNMRVVLDPKMNQLFRRAKGERPGE